MSILGIDYGSKRVGIATSDGENRLAFPSSVIDSKGLKPKEVAQKIVELCKEKGIEIVVMGESKNLKGERNTIMDQIDVCAQELKNQGLSVFFEPEWFSTQQAERFQGKIDTIDSSAAAVILQAYLDNNR
jgi:putative Holliday junction resolvase